MPEYETICEKDGQNKYVQQLNLVEALVSPASTDSYVPPTMAELSMLHLNSLGDEAALHTP